jgi:hypothetical protein
MEGSLPFSQRDFDLRDGMAALSRSAKPPGR